MAIQRWEIDPSHSRLHFTVRHLVISRVHGVFERWRGRVDYDPRDPSASKVAVEIDASSIDTHESRRDEHLRSADFLDVQRFPVLTYESRRVEPLGANRFRVVGLLTLHGVFKEVDLDVDLLGASSDPYGNERLGFRARTSLNRKDFGLMWNQILEGGGVLVGDAIDVDIDIEAVKAKAAATAA